ncbi:transcriptional regulator [Cohnella algarum]|uniref:transcriptional regulator n=1 Tax=Cohnella algarum TaxID=2044859 RepID=UPI001F071ECE|nr:transcriptional regulator [Cohnella algarum]
MTGKASTRAKNKYNAANYDKFLVVTPKGKKDDYAEHAKKHGYASLNSFVVQAIEEKIQREGSGDHETDPS